MRKIRLKAAKHIFEQLQKDDKIPIDAEFDPADVDMSDIHDGDRFYGGWTFVSSVSEIYATQGLLSAYADAAHMEGKGQNTYGIFLNIGTYTANRNLGSIVSGHGIGAECKEEWLPRFKAAADVANFDCEGRVILVDMEKSIDISLDMEMTHAKKFNDERHVLKNMTPKLGPDERKTGPALYSRALRAASTLEVDQIVAQYGPNQKKWLERFSDSELYRAYSPGLKDGIVTSQGAESAMLAAVANNIRRVEPLSMIKINVETEASKFYAEKVPHLRNLLSILAFYVSLAITLHVLFSE